MEAIIIQTIAAAIGTFSFAILFNIRGKFLIWASIGGGIGWFFYKIILMYTGSSNLSMFGSAIIFSLYSEVLARKLKTPVTTLIVCGLIPLVPGSGMYYTMSSAISGNVLDTWNLAASTLASAGCLALGVIFTSTLTRLVINLKNKTYSSVKTRLNNKYEKKQK